MNILRTIAIVAVLFGLSVSVVESALAFQHYGGNEYDFALSLRGLVSGLVMAALGISLFAVCFRRQRDGATE